MVKKIALMFMLISILYGFNTGTPGDNILPYPILKYKLPNGLNVVTVPFDSPGIASFFIIVRTGSRNEIEQGVTGFAHFFEHMMFRGTDKYPKDKYEEVLKSIGASANANTSSDRTVYHMTGNALKLEKMFEVEADRFQNLNYPIHDFKVEAGAVKGEYTKNYADPDNQLGEAIQEKAFAKHTYKHTTMGFFKDIVDMPNQYEYSLKFYKRFYRPEYCTILCVGDVTQEKVNALAEKYFSGWKHGDYVADIPVEPPQTETITVHVKNAETLPSLSLNFKGPAFNTTEIDLPALNIISSIFFSNKSELYKKLVLKEKKVRSMYCSPPFNVDPDLISIDAKIKNKEDLQYVKDEIMKVLEIIKSVPVDEKLLQSAKSNFKYSFAMRIDNPGAIANTLSAFISASGDPESVNMYYGLYDKVTSEDLMNTAKKYFIETGLTIGTISSDENSPVK